MNTQQYTKATFIPALGSHFMTGFLGMGNNPMVGATVAVAVAIEQATKK